MADNIHSTHQGLFQTTTFEITTGSREVALDITDRCAAFLTERAAGRDGLLNVFVPHATAESPSWRPDPAATTTSSPPCANCSPPTTAGATGTAAPATAGTTWCPAWSPRTPPCR